MNKLTKLMVAALFLVCGAVMSAKAGGFSIPTTGMLNEAAEPVTEMVRNVSGLDLEAGDVVAWASSVNTSTYQSLQLGVDITTTTSLGDRMTAGVLTRDLSDGNYGPMAILGITDINVNCTTSAGDVLVSSATTRVYTISGSTSSETKGVGTTTYSMSFPTTTVTVIPEVVGVALESTTSSTTVKALLKLN